MSAIDTEMLVFVHGWSGPWLDELFRASHLLGRLPCFLALTLAMVGWHGRAQRRRQALGWLAVGLATLLLLEGTKALVARPRPELWPRVVAESGWSFPSGHALASAALYPLAAWEAARRWPRRAALCYTAAILASLWLGVGRVYLGVHFPSDVLAGWTAGAALGLVAIRWLATLASRDRSNPRGLPGRGNSGADATSETP